jgi:hypothetical protein
MHDDAEGGIPDYGSARQARTVSDAPASAVETDPGDGDDGGFAGFLDAVQDRAQAVLSDREPPEL